MHKDNCHSRACPRSIDKSESTERGGLGRVTLRTVEAQRARLRGAGANTQPGQRAPWELSSYCSQRRDDPLLYP